MLRGADIEDFSFTDREGKERTFFDIIASARPDATIYLLLFDPDCNDCHATIDSLRQEPAINAGLAEGSVKVIAVYPVEEVLQPTDPNLIRYRQIAPTLPASWIVGIDNGSIFERDFYQWETLPLLIRYEGVAKLYNLDRQM